MQLTPEEAARALDTIESSRQAMRSAAVAHRGHLYLWLWGAIWTAMALLAQLRVSNAWQISNWLAIAGTLASVVIGFTQSRQVRTPLDRRFLAVLAAILVFAVIWPLVLGGPHDDKAGFAYTALVAMFCYVVAGIWFDYYLLWLGMAVAALILIGLLFFTAIFWWWIAVFAGGTLVATGFYVRFGWK